LAEKGLGGGVKGLFGRSIRIHRNARKEKNVVSGTTTNKNLPDKRKENEGSIGQSAPSRGGIGGSLTPTWLTHDQGEKKRRDTLAALKDWIKKPP